MYRFDYCECILTILAAIIITNFICLFIFEPKKENKTEQQCCVCDCRGDIYDV